MRRAGAQAAWASAEDAKASLIATCSYAQIVVPVDLADVLKAFTKEVIRRQPQDLVDFGAK